MWYRRHEESSSHGESVGDLDGANDSEGLVEVGERVGDRESVGLGVGDVVGPGVGHVPQLTLHASMELTPSRFRMFALHSFGFVATQAQVFEGRSLFLLNLIHSDESSHTVGCTVRDGVNVGKRVSVGLGEGGFVGHVPQVTGQASREKTPP